MSFTRRKFLTTAALTSTAGLVLGAPSVAAAQSAERFNWRMTNAYSPGSPFYVEGPGSPTDVIAKINAMSGGRLNIQHFSAGELIPALEGFEAVQSGTIQMNAGMSFMGHMAWLYHGGGLELWEEVYAPYGMIALPLNNTGVQMTGWFREPIEDIGQLNGLRMRVPGLAGKVYSALGVDARVLPGGEIFPALERGVIDAAEFVGPYQDRRMGLQNAAKFYHTTGWHEPSTTGELLISKQHWDELPDDLKMIVKSACMAACLESVTWSEAVNGEAMTDLVDNHGVTASMLPEPVVNALREATMDTLATEANADPLVRKVHDSYMAFKANHDRWAGASERAWLNDIIGV